MTPANGMERHKLKYSRREVGEEEDGLHRSRARVTLRPVSSDPTTGHGLRSSNSAADH